MDKERNIGKRRLETACHLPIRRPEPGPCNRVHLHSVINLSFYRYHRGEEPVVGRGGACGGEGRSLRVGRAGACGGEGRSLGRGGEEQWSERNCVDSAGGPTMELQQWNPMMKFCLWRGQTEPSPHFQGLLAFFSRQAVKTCFGVRTERSLSSGTH